MDWNLKTLASLGLSNVEIELLQTLSTAKSTSDIGIETKIPRTSVAYTIKGLIKRRLIQQIKYGKRYRYIALTADQFTHEIQSLVDDVQVQKDKKKGVRVKTAKDDEFVVHVGVGEIVPAFKRIAHECRNERVKAIQHHRSYNDQVEVATPEQVVEFNNAIIKNNIIIEGMLNEGAYASYSREIKTNPQKFGKEIKSLEGRMSDYAVFPDNRFDYDAEIWIFKTTTLVINWKDKVAMEVTNKSMTSFFKDMYEYVKASSKKIDHNKQIREIVGQV